MEVEEFPVMQQMEGSKREGQSADWERKHRDNSKWLPILARTVPWAEHHTGAMVPTIEKGTVSAIEPHKNFSVLKKHKKGKIY